MEVDEEYTLSSLEKCSYRVLQQTAKAMSLPSNVKKSYLIQLIYLKKHSSPSEVELLIKKVRLERQQQAKVRRKTTKKKNTVQQQSTEISSTSGRSPPITMTPKRSGHIMTRCSPDFITYARPYQRSDRVLRSFKSVKSNHVVNNSLIGMVSAKDMNRENRALKVDLGVKKVWSGMELVPVNKSVNTSPIIIRKPQRRLSGIYPLNETKPPNVSVRRSDGTVCKLKAVIQKAVNKSFNFKSENLNTQSLLKTIKNQCSDTYYQNAVIRPQVSLNKVKPITIKQSDVYNSTFNHKKTIVFPQTSNKEKSNTNSNSGSYSIYYHKTISTKARSPQITYKIAELDNRSHNRASAKDNFVLHSRSDKNYQNKPLQITYNNEKAVNRSNENLLRSQIHANYEENNTNSGLDEDYCIRYNIEDISSQESYKEQNSLHRSNQNSLNYRQNTTLHPQVTYIDKTESNNQSNPNSLLRPSNNHKTKETNNNSVFNNRSDENRSDVDRSVDNRSDQNFPMYNIQQNNIPLQFSCIDDTTNSRSDECESVYYHKKIRSDMIRSVKTQELTSFVSNEPRLPKISDVFSKFNMMYSKDDIPTSYSVDKNQVEISPTHYFYRPEQLPNQTSMLESLYNVKNSFLNNTPLLPYCTTSNSKYMFSTPLLTTACVSVTPLLSSTKADPSASGDCDIFDDFASDQNNSNFNMDDDDIPRVHDFFKNFRCDDEDLAKSFKDSRSSENATSSELSANVTIPEMVEDAFELISQDGDYMERMGMDIRMQCMLCSWAGPKISLEYHIRQEHQSHIIQADTQEWCATYTLGALCTPRWVSRIVERDQQLYVLSAKYEDPDCFMATLSIISSDADTPKNGRLTIYNKVTGEPFIWEGEILQIPPSLPYENALNCLKLQLSKMDLLPNSANLKLLNRELVLNSPTKVVVGQPELDRILISLIVKIYET